MLTTFRGDFASKPMTLPEIDHVTYVAACILWVPEDIFTHAQLSAWGAKCPPFLFFCVCVCRVTACKFMFAYIYTQLLLYVGWEVGDYWRKIIAAEKCIVVSEKFMEDLKRSIRVLKCIYAWNIRLFCIKTKTVRVWRNQPSIPRSVPL